MAQRWLRGVIPTHAPVGDGTYDYARVAREFNVFVYYFLRRLLGFSYVDEFTQDAGDTYENNHSASGSDGALTSVDFTFSAASASFVVGDIGKFLCIVDPTNEVNCGIYPITGHTSGTQVTIDYLSGVTNYPVAATGLEWYLLDDTNSPGRENDYWVLQANHATSPYTMKGENIGNNESSSNTGTVLEISPFASAWDSVGDVWLKTVMTTKSKLPRGNRSVSHGPVYAYGDTDASFFIVWTHTNAALNNVIGGGVAIGEKLEAPRIASEMVLPMGQTQWGNDDGNWVRGASFNNTMSENVFLSNISGLSINTQWAGYRDGGADYFSRSLTGPNNRTGKRDGAPIFVFADYDGNSFEWAPLAKLPTNRVSLSTATILGDIKTFDSDNFMHIRDGLTVPWPGLPLV